MKILLVNKFWGPKGGSERYTFLLRDLLEANGHEVVSFGGEDGDVAMKPLRALWDRHAARKLDELLKEVKPDIAHLQNFSREISPSILPVLRRHGVPIVWTLHDLDAFRPGYRHPHAWGRRAYAYVEYLLHQRMLDVYRKHVDAIVAPSRFAADVVREWGWQGRVRVVPNFITQNAECRMQNTAPLPPNPPSPQSGEGGGLKPVLFVGRLVEEKGILDFLEAARRVAGVPFAVVGNGEEAPGVPRDNPPHPSLTLREGAPRRGVRWIGSLSPEETQRQIASAAIVVVPSTIPEIAPYVILEAMAAGVPVVASNIGGIPELVRDGETGALVPPQDPEVLAKTIEMVYRDEVRRQRLGERARAIATAEYGPERHYERIIAIYTDLAHPL